MLKLNEAKEKQGLLVIMAEYEGLKLNGVARCDHVNGAGGKVKLRAKFGHGVKAILDFDDYGEGWTAEATADERSMR